MTVEQYRARIRRLGLTPLDRRSAGEYLFHLGRDGQPYPIREPDALTPEEREAVIEHYEAMFPIEE